MIMWVGLHGYCSQVWKPRGWEMYICQLLFTVSLKWLKLWLKTHCTFSLSLSECYMNTLREQWKLSVRQHVYLC